MKKRNVLDDEAVSPVIATILMVAITVVLAATLYMMIDPGDTGSSTEAMSGRIDGKTDGWLVEVDSGSTEWDGDKIQIYNTDLGSASTPASVNNNPTTGTANLTFNDVNGNTLWVVWNDNQPNEEIDGGDSFRIVVDGGDPSVIGNDYEFRIENTNLQLALEA